MYSVQAGMCAFSWTTRKFVVEPLPQQRSKQRQSAAKGLFAPLLNQIDMSNPTQFALPEDIRHYFAGGVSEFVLTL
jgi:hypothetical protein